MFTARYTVIPYIKQITFRLEKVKEQLCGSTQEDIRVSKIIAWNIFNFVPGWISIRFSFFIIIWYYMFTQLLLKVVRLCYTFLYLCFIFGRSQVQTACKEAYVWKFRTSKKNCTSLNIRQLLIQ